MNTQVSMETEEEHKMPHGTQNEQTTSTSAEVNVMAKESSNVVEKTPVNNANNQPTVSSGGSPVSSQCEAPDTLSVEIFPGARKRSSTIEEIIKSAKKLSSASCQYQRLEDATCMSAVDTPCKPSEESPPVDPSCKETAEPPDGGWGWVIVAGCALAFFLSGGISRSFTLIYQELLHVFNKSAAATSTTAAIFGTVKMCSSPLVSMLCNKFSKRRVALLGGLLAGVAILMTSFPVSLTYVYFTYGILAALGINMVMTPCFIIISEYFKKRRARAMSFSMMGGSFGGIALPPLLHFLFRSYGYSGAMLIISGMMLNLCIAGALFRSVEKQKNVGTTEETKSTQKSSSKVINDDTEDLDEEVQTPEIRVMKMDTQLLEDSDCLDSESIDDCELGNEHNSPEEESDDDNGHNDNNGVGATAAAQFENNELLPESPLSDSKRRVSFHDTVNTTLKPRRRCSLRKTQVSKLKDRWTKFERIVGLHLFRNPQFVFYSLLMLGSMLSLSVSGTFLSGLVQDIGLDQFHTGILLSASSILDIPSKFTSGFVFDLKKVRPYRSLLLVGVGFMTGVFVLCMGFCRNYAVLFVIYLLYTFFASAYHTQHATVLADLVGGPNVSSAMGLCRLSQGVGFILGPTIGGLLCDITGVYRTAYIFAGSVLLAFTLAYAALDLRVLWRQKYKKPKNIPKGHVARYRHDSISTIA